MGGIAIVLIYLGFMVLIYWHYRSDMKAIMRRSGFTSVPLAPEPTPA